ncbi:uncharacterized protein G2W53_015966 [Senna tora]|uniref:Uncharacterized protein n=1 Tax=Senna tora TaxID=362788 RepID=A0A834WVX0_9FABA|nr:uncharacterized protein G2W53_015966 [Senna tora]
MRDEAFHLRSIPTSLIGSVFAAEDSESRLPLLNPTSLIRSNSLLRFTRSMKNFAIRKAIAVVVECELDNS